MDIRIKILKTLSNWGKKPLTISTFNPVLKIGRIEMTMAVAYFHPCQHIEGALKLKAEVPGMWTTRGQSHSS
ncbi:hypothetical protein POTOM_047730 [Populus tomentosa]|uniref:Uncharacterized protein n=1 Tax=Populus tomentosa TaxID=118781 RepID=A0A8X7YBH1_POPTO|nr:hypothetical protein POTOM_047730 [Populus tomentosa]